MPPWKKVAVEQANMWSYTMWINEIAFAQQSKQHEIDYAILLQKTPLLDNVSWQLGAILLTMSLLY